MINAALAHRLHAIWERRCARFRDAHYAYRLADEHADRVGRAHPSYPQARELARRAQRRMAILHRQTGRLARMQIAAVGLAATAALVTPAAQAGDEWTSPQIEKAVALAALTVADWGQTRNIARHPYSWTERNPLIGEYPSVGRVDRYFAASMLLGAIALDALPTRWRDTALTVGIAYQAGFVAHNLSLGVAVRF